MDAPGTSTTLHRWSGPRDGRVEKQIGTIHDITDRHHAEDEARQLQERLTHFSRLSTMGEMAAGLGAMKINQPLSAIATYSQACQRLLRQAEPDIPDVISALEQVNAQALRAGEVIRRLRNFVKNREVKREWVNCERLLEDLRTLAETDARLHNVRLRLDVARDLPGVHADAIQLQQVVLNLVRNAIDAMVEVPGGPQGNRAEGLWPRRGPGPDHRRRPGVAAWRRARMSTCSTRFSLRRLPVRGSGWRSATPSSAPMARACGTLRTSHAACAFISRCLRLRQRKGNDL